MLESFLLSPRGTWGAKGNAIILVFVKRPRLAALINGQENRLACVGETNDPTAYFMAEVWWLAGWGGDPGVDQSWSRYTQENNQLNASDFFLKCVNFSAPKRTACGVVYRLSRLACSLRFIEWSVGYCCLLLPRWHFFQVSTLLWYITITINKLELLKKSLMTIWISSLWCYFGIRYCSKWRYLTQVFKKILRFTFFFKNPMRFASFTCVRSIADHVPFHVPSGNGLTVSDWSNI